MSLKKAKELEMETQSPESEQAGLERTKGVTPTSPTDAPECLEIWKIKREMEREQIKLRELELEKEKEELELEKEKRLRKKEMDFLLKK